jgi:hypothetical protein
LICPNAQWRLRDASEDPFERQGHLGQSLLHSPLATCGDKLDDWMWTS